MQNLLGRRGGRGGRAVIAEIRAKRNDADAGKRVRRENERGGKRFLLWSRDFDYMHDSTYNAIENIHV